MRAFSHSEKGYPSAITKTGYLILYKVKSYKAYRRNGVADGDRTHDHWNHNPGLYRLSYSHRSV